MQQQHPQARPALRWVLIVLLAFGIGFSGWRGPYRSLVPKESHQGVAWDFGLVYSLSRAWIIGTNPYELSGVSQAWLSSSGDPDADPSIRRSAGILVYPPTTLALLSPLAALPWKLAAFLWVALNIAGVAVFLAVAGRLAGLRGNALLALWTAGVWLAPIVTGFRVGQTAVVTLALIAVGEWLRIRARAEQEAGGSWASGVMLGLATALKPQMGLLFVVYEAGRLRWKSALAAAAALSLTAGIGVVRLQAAGVSWWPSWQRNIHNFPMVEDGDPTRANAATRHHMVDLRYALHCFTDNRELVKWTVYGICAALSLAYLLIDLRRGRQKGEGRTELVSIAMTAAISLLIVYHRAYDAILIVFPMAVAIRLIVDRTDRVLGWAMMALCAVFFAPGPVVLSTAAQRGWVPASFSGSALWQDLIMPHEAWSILALATLLIVARSRWKPVN
jgi:hypothetical protein